MICVISSRFFLADVISISSGITIASPGSTANLDVLPLTLVKVVARAALKAGSTLEAKLYRGNTLVSSADPQTTVAGNKWYPFLVSESDTLKEGLYRVDVYLDGHLVKSSPFEVKASK